MPTRPGQVPLQLAMLGEASVEIEHAHQARPGTAPVSHGKDRALVAEQAGEKVMAVLPDGLANHYRRMERDIAEDLVPVFLAIDETVLPLGIVGMGAVNLTAFTADGLHDRLLGLVLGRPALAISGKPQIAARNEIDNVGHDELPPSYSTVL